jgi:DHA2 family multidrug resistance protein
MTTIVARRSQFHQDHLSLHVTAYDHTFRNLLGGLNDTFIQRGSSPTEAVQQTYGHLYGYVQMQSAAMAFVDAIWVMAVSCLCMLPLVFLMKKNNPRTAQMSAH